MEPNGLVDGSMHAARYEFQVKFRGAVPEPTLLALRAHKLGTSSHEDRFYVRRGAEIRAVDELIRLRKEGEDDVLFTYKGPVANRRLRNRLVVDRLATPDDLAAIRSTYREVAVVAKQRTIYMLGDTRIALDRVERLGSFVEIEVGSDEDADTAYQIASLLGLDLQSATQLSYFELALNASRPLHRFLLALHDRVGRFTFGISSAVMTTMGVVASLDAATGSRAAVLGGIVSIAVADSVSDSFGIFTSKKAERGVSAATALRAALGTLWGKMLFAGTFLVPFIALEGAAAVNAAVVWGAALLVLVSAQIAFVKEESFWKNVLGNVAVAALIVALARLVGSLVGQAG